jgi:RNA polymerase sigma factor (sigma-70 family)
MPNSLEIKALMDYARTRAMQQTANADWAEDSVAEAFARLSALSYWPENPKGWISTVVRNILIDRSRQKFEVDRVQIPAAASSTEIDEAGLDLDAFVVDVLRARRTSEMAFLRAAVSDLREQVSDKEWELLLASVEGVSHQEIADVLGYASAATVTQTLSRIRKKLQPHLSGWAFDQLS